MKRSVRDIFWKVLRRIGWRPNLMDCPEIRQMIEAANKDGRAGFVMDFEVVAGNEWLVTSDELPGLVTGGSLKQFSNIEEQVIDAIFTYFGVPSRYCDDNLFKEEKKLD